MKRARVTAEPVDPSDLRIGDVYSFAGPNYWNCAEKGGCCWGMVHLCLETIERIESNSPARAKLYRLTVEEIETDA